MEEKTKEIVKIFLKNKRAEIWDGVKFLCFVSGICLVVLFFIWFYKDYKNTIPVLDCILGIIVGILIIGAIIAWININWAKANLEYLELTKHRTKKNENG